MITRQEQISVAVSQVLLSEGPCAFFTLLAMVQRAFPDADVCEVDQAARQWERGEVGRYVYSLEALPVPAGASDGQMSLFAQEATG